MMRKIFIFIFIFILTGFQNSYACDALSIDEDLEHESTYDIASYYRILELMDQNNIEEARKVIEQYQRQEIAKLDIYREKCGLSKATEELLKKVDLYNKKKQ